MDHASTGEPRSPLAALLFDLDGTLVHSDPLHFEAWRDSLEPHGVRIDEDTYRRRVSGRLNPEIVRDLLPHLPDDDGAALIDAKEERFRSLARNSTALEGLPSLLAWAERRGVRLALVTNAPRANTDFLLAALELRDRFEVVVVSDELGVGKPDPRPYRAALERLGVAAGAGLAFEDSPSGVRSARAAGLPVVGIATTQSPEALLELGVVAVVEDFTSDRLWDLLRDRVGDRA